MKNQNSALENQLADIIARVDAGMKIASQKEANVWKLFAKENLAALLIFVALTVITLFGWMMFLRETEYSHAGLGAYAAPVLLTAGMGINVFIFFLMSFAIQQRSRVKQMARMMTEQVHQKNQEIKLNEQRFELALCGADDGLWDRNIESGTVYFSPRWKSMLGYDDAELTSSQEEWIKRIHPEDITLIRLNEKSYMNGKVKRFQREYRLRHKNGSYIWVMDRGLILTNETHKVIRLIGVMSDINERKRVEKLKGEFISTVSHELRTPLTSIAASLGLLEAGVFGELPSKALSLVNIASKNSKRLTTLVNDILDMEKLLSGKVSFRSDEMDLTELVKQSMELNFDAANLFGVNVTLSAVEHCRNVVGDKDRLLQVMSNLICNATKFSSHGSVVEIRLLQQDKFARVEIKDHGIGISQEFSSRIFDEFAQADISDTRQYGGTGLGLSISKKIVEKMGGEIGYESDFGVGSIFWFTVPSSSV